MIQVNQALAPGYILKAHLPRRTPCPGATQAPPSSEEHLAHGYQATALAAQGDDQPGLCRYTRKDFPPGNMKEDAALQAAALREPGQI
jgi:hypothetical protein